MIRRGTLTSGLAALCVIGSSGCALMATPSADAIGPAEHQALMARATAWQPTRVAEMNLRTGPEGPDAIAPLATVRCTYLDKALSGRTPKFACELPNGDELKVKYGRENGEVYAEVAATRLLWALGFGADRMYPARVECRGCPRPVGDVGATDLGDGVIRFDYAAIEHKMDGEELEGRNGAGWSWQDLDRIEPASGPEAVAHRDALKLLAVFLQHTDTKREQQRLVCLDATPPDDRAVCAEPFILINDLGKTFGRANAFNRDAPGSVNLDAWSRAPVWLGSTGCTGNLMASVTGTLDDPTISEAGRKFLADLLVQITDAQLRDLFEVARFPARVNGRDRGAAVEDWMQAFKLKVAQVTNRSCPSELEPA